MLTKILITLFVIIGACFLLLKRTNGIKNQPSSSSQSALSAKPTLWRRHWPAGLFALLGLSVFSYSVWYWFDQHKIVTVTIVSAAGTSSGVYHARKGDISEAKMITLEGVHIRFSASERLEILED